MLEHEWLHEYISANAPLRLIRVIGRQGAGLAAASGAVSAAAGPDESDPLRTQQHAARLASFLASLGVVAGDAVFVLLRDPSRLPLALGAAIRSQSRIVVLDPSLPGESLCRALEQGGARVVVTESSCTALLLDSIATIIDLETDTGYWADLADVAYVVDSDSETTIVCVDASGQQVVLSDDSVLADLARLQKGRPLEPGSTLQLGQPVRAAEMVLAALWCLLSGAALQRVQAASTSQVGGDRDSVVVKLSHGAVALHKGREGALVSLASAEGSVSDGAAGIAPVQPPLRDKPLLLGADALGSGAVVSIAQGLPEHLVEVLARFATAERRGVAELLMAVWALLLHRYADDPCITLASLGNEAGVGPTQPARLFTASFTEGTSFRDLLQQMQTSPAMLRNTTGPALENALTQARQAGFNRLCQFVVRYCGKSGKGGRSDAQRNRLDERHLQTFGLDLLCRFELANRRIRYVLTCRESFVAQGMVDRLAQSFAQLAQQCIDHPDTDIAALPVLSSQQYQMQVQDWNMTDAAFEASACIHQLFERQAALRPDAPAIYDHASACSYRELNERANRLARFIETLAGTAASNVCVMLDRRIDIPVALLAILKSGNAYVPLDAQHPQQRNAGIVREQAASIIITHACYQAELVELLEADCGARHVIYLDALPDPARTGIGRTAVAVHGPLAWMQRESTNLAVAVSAGDLAYTIFTSGSTGKPKGVMVRHQPVVNLIEWVNRTFSVGADDTLLFVTSLCFDLSVYDLFGMLAAGGRIRVASQLAIRDARALLDLLLTEPITFWDSAPANLQRLVPLLAEQPGDARHLHLRLVFLSGDWIPVKLPDAMRCAFPHAQIVSLGGATEATVWSNFYRIGEVGSGWGSIPYGKPIQNARYYIVNKRLQPCPVGVAGDLYIGGLCLADGYTSEELTRRSFVPDPFVADRQARMYRTGDLARFESDGTMIFLGRADTQVKVRGFRVELGEIEVVLQKHEDVDHAVVLLQDRNTPDPRVVAYVASRSPTLDHLRLRGFLEKYLPEPMLPNFTCVMPSLPVSGNGKVDRAALPWPLPAGAHRLAALPAGPAPVAEPALRQVAQVQVRRQLLEIVAELLHHAQLDEHTSLFEAGATSLTIVFLAERIKKTFGVEIPIDTFLAEPTVHALLVLLDCPGPAAECAEAPVVPVAQTLPDSPVQEVPQPSAPRAEADPAAARRIALIGIHFNFPGSSDLNSFWRALSRREPIYGPLPLERRQLWDASHPALAQQSFIGSYLNDIDCFDHRFFGISAPEARSMDPQERRLMESAWLCLEDAGYCVDDPRLGRVGVYCGIMRDDYASAGVEHWHRSGVTAFASNASGVSNRISHALDLKGPSLTVNTSCASAMTALHLACTALRIGECDMALVGGVNLFAHPYHQVMLRNLGFASERGVAEPFALTADGWVPGEGVATLLLKRSDLANDDRDHVYAHLLGSLIGHMGSTFQYAAPSSVAQSEGVQKLLQDTGLSPARIDLVECCAAGAAMGDAAEYNAIEKVIAGAARAVPCYLGTSKDYLGHLESTSALAQIIKAIVQLQHDQMIPLCSGAPPSPFVSAQSEQVQLLAAARPWPARGDGLARTVLVNSSGAGGATAHLLLGEQLEPASEPAVAQPHLLVLSSMSEAQLRQQADALARFLERHSPVLADAAFTLAGGRRHGEFRLALVVESVDELVRCLDAFIASPPQAAADRFATRTVEQCGGWFGVAAGAPPSVGQGAGRNGLSPTELAALARRWAGGDASLSGLTDELEARRARRISLPGYCFAKHRHWLPVAAAAQDMFLAASLPQTSLPASGSGSAAGHGPGRDDMAGRDEAAAPTEVLHTNTDPALAQANLQQFLVELVARVTETPLDHVHPKDNTQRFGLNSLTVAAMTRQLERELGEALEPTLFFAHKTIADLAAAVYVARARAVLARFAQPGYAKSAADADEPESSISSYAAPADAGSAERTESRADDASAIAVVGVAGRYPGAADLIAFWENLTQGRDCITEIPAERWRADDYLPDGVPRLPQGATRCGGFINDVDMFDALFFGVAPSTADFMDPQVRLFLQTAWEALEDAGHRSSCLKRLYAGEVGVFVGVMHGDYQLHDARTADGVYHLGGISYGSVAHQVSYSMDLSGPSMAVDTMCSASLTALHLAIDSIRRDECKAAIVGGVNLSIHPNKYIQQSLMTMHASSGRCRSFAADGDGFIPAEGVGAVVIKPLHAARRDHDQIYALIRSSHINSGGKTYGYTVPNPTAQAALIETALRKGGVDPSALSYIEAHGTGTALGDPIEISGLTQAFYRAAPDQEQLRARGQFCAIGSVKSNIGHCESAAGIAGLTKVLLQLKHKMLVPSLHSESLNPSIDFGNSPFRVQRELAVWPAPPTPHEGARARAPRMAGISSFGAGGANAHVIVEEYAKPEPAPPDRASLPVLVVLSARSRPQLEQYAAGLKRSIEAYRYGDADLPSIGYTLAVGRDEHAHRLAVICSTVAALISRLDEFATGGLEGHYRHVVPRRHDVASAAGSADRPAPQRIVELFTQGDLQPVADGWLRGQQIEWRPAYHATWATLTKCSLATYPFARRSHWIGGRFEPRRKSSATAVRLHPMVHVNISNFERLAFLSTFGPEDFFLRDHVLGGRQLLPGVAHLEMARAAAGLLEDKDASGQIACIRGVVWMQPVVLEGASASVCTELRRDETGRLRFRIVSVPQDQPVRVHSQGEIQMLPAAAAPTLDLALLRAQCASQRIAAAAFYHSAGVGGAQYGPAMQALSEVAISQDVARPFVLAQLRLSAAVAADHSSYVLHPSLMDAALQAVAALSGIVASAAPAGQGTAGMSLPFALEEVRVYSACPAQAVVWARPAEAGRVAGAPVSRFDIDLADAHGRVAVALRGYTTRSVQPVPSLPAAALTVLAPGWTVVASPQPAVSGVADALVCFVGISETPDLGAVQGQHQFLVSKAQSPEARYGDFVTQLVDICRHIATQGAANRLLCVVVQSEAADSALMCGLAGLLASAGREYPSLQTRLLGFPIVPRSDVLADLLAAQAQGDARELFYEGGRRLERRLVAVDQWKSSAKYQLPADAVILISGGMGGVGRALVRYLTGLGQPVTLVLVGRRPLDRQAQEFLDANRTASARIVYESLDVSDEAHVVASLANLRQHYGSFTGVLHCAGVNRDSFIANKSAQEIHEVLAAKVAGVAHLERATRQDPLAFFVVFSSLSSLFGNPGQVDYTAANGYLDGFVHERMRRVREGRGHGHSACVNWPLWANGGMQPGAAARADMEQRRMLPMKDEDAMAVLEHLALVGSGQWAVISHEAAVPAPTTARTSLPPTASTPPSRTERGADALQQLQQRLLQEVSAQLKIDESDLDVDSDFSEYGFDSISLTEFANRISQTSGMSLLPTIFFEYPSIAAFSAYLLAQSGDFPGEPAVAHALTPSAGNAAAVAAPVPPAPAAAPAALEELLHAHVLSVVSALLKIETRDLDLDAELSEYGFDSINLTELGNRLQAFFDVPVMPTVFFEHPTLRRFCAHLAATQGSAVACALQPRAAPASVAPPMQQPAPPIAGLSITGSAPALSAPSPWPVHARAVQHAAEPEPVAIIGMSGAFPAAKNIEAFWSNLAAGVDGIGEIPPDRWNWREFYGDPLLESNKTNIKWGGFIDGVGDFDPAFFGISPREALYMDPQQRLLMLHVWHAIEDAGHAPESLAGSDTAIFVGTTVSGYVSLIAQSGHAIQSYSATGISPSVGPNRISYLLDLHGPSEPIETACSSSLVAIHRAVTTLRARQCALAIAGGVNTIVTPEVHMSFNKAGMLSQDGRCKTFSSSADGYSRGEGVGILVLKRLCDAERDHDQIHGLILASVENHGGKANTLTSPNPVAQAMLLKAAYREAGVDPRTVSYIECHGTGTELGDPVEINGLKSAFRELYAEAEQRYGEFASADGLAAPWCALASVKSNIGHLEYAAGVAGVIKVLLQMRHQTLVPSLHSLPRNAYIDLQDSPFEILSQSRPWPAGRGIDGRPLPRRAGVSSYGFGGVNAHVVIEAYVAAPPSAFVPGGIDAFAIVLSARTDEQLIRQAAQLRAAIAQRGCRDADLADIAFTLQVGRNAMRKRFACCVASVADLTDVLDAFVEGAAPAGRWMSGDAKTEKAEVSALARDADFQALVSTWTAQRKYLQLLRLWVAGHAVAWDALAGAMSPHPMRISLPGYPFDLKRYWIEPVKPQDDTASDARPAAPPAVPLPRSTALPAVAAKTENKPVVRLLDPAGIESTLRSGAPGRISPQAAVDRPEGASRPPIVLAPLAGGGAPGAVEPPSGDNTAPIRTSDAAFVVPVVSMPAQVAVLDSLQRLLAEALFMEADAIDIEVPFNELGLDSVTGVEWVQAVNTTFGIKVASAEIFSFPTLIQFAAFVMRKIAPAGDAALLLPPGDGTPAAMSVDEPVPAALIAATASAAATGAVTPAAATSGVSLDEVTQFLKMQLGEVLYLESEVRDPDLPFSDLGLDSVTGVEWVHAISARYSIKLATSELFSHPTLRQLSQRVCALAGARMAPAPSASSQPAEARNTPPASAAFSGEAASGIRDEHARSTGRAHPPATAAMGSAADRKIEPAGRPAIDEDQVAVIGMACRFADASSPAELWRNIASAKDSVRQADRWPNDAIDGHVLWGSFLSDIDRFDPMFFKISASEAKYMDPQQRVFLEECWKAVEDGGYAGSIEGSNCGVYVGCGSGDYGSLIKAAPPQAFWGNAMSVIASRISYYLDLHGPAVAIDTACSSSLVAIHTACRALVSAEVDLALAGGVTVLSTPAMIGSAAGAGMLSPTGRCHSFDSRADGFVAGEGAGVLLLKRLRDALRDNDNIHGVIRGSGINQDGLTNGITAPSTKSQERLESAVYSRFGIDPASITLVEAHGTGTILGDPIEFQALCEAFRKRTDRTQFCALGSIKSNIGHTIAAAGVAGVLKVLLALKHRRLPPSLHYRQSNPAIDFAHSPFYVNTQLQDWVVGAEEVRRAAVSSFGFSGTNAHVVIDEAPTRADLEQETHARLVVLSAHSPRQVGELVDALLDCLGSNHASLTSVAYTLAVGRRQLPYRLAVVAHSIAGLRNLLLAWRDGARTAKVHSNCGEAKVHSPADAAMAPLSLAALERETGISLADPTQPDGLLEYTAVQFTRGRRINFGTFFTATPRRVSLPVYPLADERYWVDRPAAIVPVPDPRGGPSPQTSRLATVAPAIASEDWLLESLYQGGLSVDEVLNTLP
ncbi:amino acid adenylation domain-containing protein [Tahibacter sp.]|uniref:amino acid adenylation domain-containing protein n=1 Tax=Tahibacter sp. TaxID=2056211 RepID=UPI0028C4ACD0|nr:amino acid adenylation domain-containing protein [Tahibacter sp.]